MGFAKFKLRVTDDKDNNHTFLLLLWPWPWHQMPEIHRDYIPSVFYTSPVLTGPPLPVSGSTVASPATYNVGQMWPY